MRENYQFLEKFGKSYKNDALGPTWGYIIDYIHRNTPAFTIFDR